MALFGMTEGRALSKPQLSQGRSDGLQQFLDAAVGNQPDKGNQHINGFRSLAINKGQGNGDGVEQY